MQVWLKAPLARPRLISDRKQLNLHSERSTLPGGEVITEGSRLFAELSVTWKDVKGSMVPDAHHPHVCHISNI